MRFGIFIDPIMPFMEAMRREFDLLTATVDGERTPQDISLKKNYAETFALNDSYVNTGIAPAWQIVKKLLRPCRLF